MILAAHQPTYFPSVTYFLKMAQSNVFLIADDLQFSAHGNFNRTRIKSEDNDTWLTVPILSKNKGIQKINEVEIDNHHNWLPKHLKTLEISYKNAGYFGLLEFEFEKIFTNSWEKLFDLNLASINLLKKYLLIKTKLCFMSSFPSNADVNQRLIQIMKEMNCKTYLVESQFSQYINVDVFSKAGLNVIFRDFHHPAYRQSGNNFIRNLSALDLILNEGELSYRFLSK